MQINYYRLNSTHLLVDILADLVRQVAAGLQGHVQHNLQCDDIIDIFLVSEALSCVWPG